MRMAPPSSSSRTIKSRSPPLTVGSPTTFLATCPLVKDSSSPSRLRFPVTDVPFVSRATSGSGAAAGLGFRGISKARCKATGLESSSEGSVLEMSLAYRPMGLPRWGNRNPPVQDFELQVDTRIFVLVILVPDSDKSLILYPYL